jgi:hypothetical protein
VSVENVWHHVTTHREEIAWAIGLAIIFAIIADFMRIGSILRDGVRFLKNKRAGRSAEKLRKRIAELQRTRDSYAAILVSDKYLYLHTLRAMLIVLVFICIGAGLFILSHFVAESYGVAIFFTFDIPAGGIFAIAAVVGIYGLQLAEMDTKDKVANIIARLDTDIAELNVKLEART